MSEKVRKIIAQPLVCLDVRQMIYTRCFGLDQRTAYRAKTPLTQSEVEQLRVSPPADIS